MYHVDIYMQWAAGADAGQAVPRFFDSEAKELKGERINNCLVHVAGDPVCASDFSELVRTCIEGDSWQSLSEVSGQFAVFIWDSSRKQLSLITDFRGQKHLYLCQTSSGLQAFTKTKLFLQHNPAPRINRGWIYEVLFFNYPVGDTCLFEGMTRVLQAEVRQFDHPLAKGCSVKYAKYPSRNESLLRGQAAVELVNEALKEATTVLGTRSSSSVCCFTSGWDGRTIFTYCPAGVRPYTYGAPGSKDVEYAARAAKRLGEKHLPVFLDESFVKKIPEYAVEAIVHSGGWEKANRASLTHVYRYLRENHGSPVDQVISGLGFDEIFKGRMTVCKDLALIFRGGLEAAEYNSLGILKKEVQEDAREWIHSRLLWLQDEFGPFQDPQHHLLYDLYVVHPCYFYGEVSQAEQFVKLGIPCLDPRVIRVAFQVEFSTLEYSQYSTGSREDGERFALQARLLNMNRRDLARMEVRHRRPDLIARSRFLDTLYHAWATLKWRVSADRKSKWAPLENWSKWLLDDNQQFVMDTLGTRNSIWRDFYNEEMVYDSLKRRDLTNVEKAMRLPILEGHLMSK